MPTVPADRLERIARDLLIGAGATEDEAASVADGVIGANLAGHDSHGIIQIPSYIDRIEAGHIVCGAPMDVVRETATTMVVDGNWGFGYHVSKFVMESIIGKAAASGVAAATVYRQGHVGRVAAYPIMAAEGGDDRHDDGRLREVGERAWYRSAGERRGWARTRSASRCRATSKARCSSIWQRARSRRGRSVWPSRAVKDDSRGLDSR